jgi:hypothetical protein
MEIIMAIPLLMIPLFWPVVTGLMATSFGRNFWTWFIIGIPLPFIGAIILVCLPSKKETNKIEDHAIGIPAKA